MATEQTKMYCYRHPNRETGVSCSECGRGICPDCMVFAPVGIRCPDHAGRARKSGFVARAKGLAAELLGRIGKTVEEKSADQEKVVQHCVCGKSHVAGTRALCGEEQPHGNQRRCADHDVAVDAEHPLHLDAVQ